MYKIANKIKLRKKVSHFRASTFTDNFGGKLIKNSRFLTYFLTFLGGVWLREKRAFSVVYTTSFTTMMVFGREGTFAVAINLSRVGIPEV